MGGAYNTQLVRTLRNFTCHGTRTSTPLAAPDQLCCDVIGEARGIATSCFTSWGTASWKGCLDPTPILSDLEGSRCNEETKCRDDSICVRPIDDSLLRVTVADPQQTSPNRIVLWKGPSTEILDEGASRKCR